MKYLILLAFSLVSCFSSADELKIIRDQTNEQPVYEMAANHPERLMSSPLLDHQRMAFYGLTNKVELISYLWNYWAEKPGETLLFDDATSRAEQAWKSATAFHRIFDGMIPPTAVDSVVEEVDRALAVLTDHETQRYCRPQLRGQLYDRVKGLQLFRRTLRGQ